MTDAHSATDRVKDRTLVLYDGDCSFCNASVLRLLRIDRGRKLAYAAQQGELAEQLCNEGVVPRNLIDDTSTVVLVESPGKDARVSVRSDAGIRAVAAAGGFWKLARGLLIIPRFIRDGAYDLVARNRYRWFGKQEKDVCRLLTPEEKACFLD